MGLLLKANYSTSLEAAGRSIRYHAFRSRELPGQERGAFSRDSDHADIARFIRGLQDPLTADRMTPRGPYQPPKLHRLILSLSRKEFEQCGLTGWKAVVREGLADWERRRGIRLEWVAAEHLSPTHPHVHVDIKSVYLDSEGRPHRLRLTREMLRDMRWSINQVLQRERERHWREVQLEQAIQRAEERAERLFLRGLQSLATSLLYHLGRWAREEERHAEPLVRRRKPPRRMERGR